MTTTQADPADSLVGSTVPVTRTARWSVLRRAWPPVIAIAVAVGLWWLATSVLAAPTSLLRQTAPQKALPAVGELLSRGVLLSGDTIFANPDRTSVSFMRSYPNRIPLSGRVAERIAEHVSRRPFDRLYNNFAGVVPQDARAVVVRSAQRHAAWTRGDHDDLT